MMWADHDDIDTGLMHTAARPARAPSRAALLTRPAWLFPLVTYAMVQAAAAVVFVVASGGHYARLVSAWDGGFYLSIAESGAYGTVGGEGEWSYYPAYPFIVRAVASISGVPVLATAVTLSLLAGAGAMVVLHRLVADLFDLRTARVVTVLTCTWIAAPVLQMTYTDGLGLLLVCLVLDRLARHRYRGLVVVLPLLALTRGVLPAVAAVALAEAVAQRRSASRWRAAAGVAACAAALSLVWPALVGLVTGDPRHYLVVTDMWAANAVARSWIALLTSWGPVGCGATVLVVGLLVWVAWRGLPERTPLVLRAWVVAYPLFVLFVTYPSGSIARYLLPAFPLALVFAPRGTGPRWFTPPVALAAGVGLVGQAAWICFFVASTRGPVP